MEETVLSERSVECERLHRRRLGTQYPNRQKRESAFGRTDGAIRPDEPELTALGL